MLGGGFSLPSAPAPSGNNPQAIWGAYNASQQASRNSNQQLFNWFQGNANPILAQQQQALQSAFQFLYGTNQSNIRSINKDYTAKSGQLASSLIDRGLGNATIQGNMQKGLDVAHSDALSGSRAAFGGRMFDAAYQSAMANSGLAENQLSTLFNGTNIGYPDFGAFAQAAMHAGSGVGGGLGFGGLTVGDMSRPVGGPQPSWAFYEGGGGFPGAPPGGSMGGAPPAWGPNTSGLYPAGFAKDEYGAVPGSQTYGGGRGGMGYGAGSSMETASMAGLYAPQAEATGY